MAKNGANIATLSGLLGHSDIRLTSDYVGAWLETNDPPTEYLGIWLEEDDAKAD